MNFRILWKAMSFMFLPTLSVLCLLLVGFFDPIALWEFIRSNSGGAIFVRVILFIIEVTFVAYFYFKYLYEEEFEAALKDPESKCKKGRQINSYTEARGMLNSSSDNEIFLYDTANPNIKIIQKK